MRLATIRDALSDATLRAELAEAALRERNVEIVRLRAELDDRSARAGDMEQRLVFGDEHARILSGETSALRADAQAARTELAELRAELMTAREQVRTIERDNARLRDDATAAARERDAASAELARQAERIRAEQPARAELEARCAKLTTALAAKGEEHERLAVQNAGLADELDAAAAQNARGLRELQLLNQTYLDELRRERSERALMRHALEIARGSRQALEKRCGALRRAGRGLPDDDAAAGGKVLRLNAAGG